MAIRHGALADAAMRYGERRGERAKRGAQRARAWRATLAATMIDTPSRRCRYFHTPAVIDAADVV